MSSVRIETKAFTDPRFLVLSGLLRFADADHAIIKVAKVWAFQTETFTDEIPTYVVGGDILEAMLGPDSPRALVTARLAVAEPTGFYMRGTRGRIEWLWRKRQNGRLGGRPVNGNADHESKPIGLASVNLNQTDCEPSANPLSPSLSPSPISLIPDSASRAKPKRRITSDWKPTPKHYELARSLGLDCDAQAEQFRDHFISKGEPRADWDASFRTWLRNAKRFGQSAQRVNAGLADPVRQIRTLKP